MIGFIVFGLGMYVLIKALLELSRKKSISIIDTNDSDTPEEFYDRVEALIRENVDTREILEEISEFRKAEEDKTRLKPEVSRDQLIMRQQMKVLRHSDSAGIARLEREDLHKDINLEAKTVPISERRLSTKMDKKKENHKHEHHDHDCDMEEDYLDERMKMIIYSEILSKPKAYK